MNNPAVAPDASARVQNILTVRRPSGGLPSWALYGMAGALGFGIFLVLASQRESTVDANPFAPTANAAIVSPPPLRLEGTVSSEAVPQPFVESPFKQERAPFAARLPDASYVTAPQRLVEPSSLPSQPSRSGRTFSDLGFASQPSMSTIPDRPMPALVMDRGISRIYRDQPSTASGGRHQSAQGGSQQAGENPVLRPRQQLQGPDILPAGSLVPAILQTPVDTSRGGPVKALVSKDIRGMDGTKIVIPKGSTLLGEYPAGAEGAGKRVMISWTRLVLPDGREVVMTFPATDRNGAAGVKGDLHTNALGRFAEAALQTALTAASFGLINRATSNTVVVGTSASPIDSGQSNDRRRITVDAGENIHVYVALPIDFSITE